MQPDNSILILGTERAHPSTSRSEPGTPGQESAQSITPLDGRGSKPAPTVSPSEGDESLHIALKMGACGPESSLWLLSMGQTLWSCVPTNPPLSPTNTQTTNSHQDCEWRERKTPGGKSHECIPGLVKSSPGTPARTPTRPTLGQTNVSAVMRKATSSH